MKFNSLCLAFLSLVFLQLFSCKRNALEDFDIAKSTPVTVSAGGLKGSIKRDNEKIIFQVGVGLSAPATKAFQVNLSLNMDTVNTLIEKNTLSNTIALSVTSIKLPNVAEVTYGVDSAFFNVEVSVTALEQFYGKKVALAVSLDDPTKGNQASKIKRTTLIVLDTKDLVKQEEIHYLSIKNGGGGILKVTKGENYKITSAGVTISLDVLLAGIPGSAFSIKTTVNTDTIASLVANKVLPESTLPLAKGKYLLDSVINFPANKTQAAYELNIPWSTMDQNLNNSTALTIRLSSSNKHVLHPVNSIVVVLIDPSVSLDNNSFITGSGTGLKVEYFKGTQMLDKDGKLPDIVGVDPSINHPNGDNWNPFPSATDNWSTRWTGEFLAPVRGEYIFYQTTWDDGARLYVNGVALVDDYTTEWDKPSRFGKIILERGQKYKIEAHHRQNVGGWSAVLQYEVPSAGVSRQVVPKTQLYPAPQ